MSLLLLWKLAAITLALGYAGLMAAYFFWWKKLVVFEPGFSIEIKRRLSVVIAARNEGTAIAACLNSIAKNNYPIELFEIIVMDDFSEDGTVSIVESLSIVNLRLLKLSSFIDDRKVINSFKKKAIELGVKHATGELIITTDADCVVPENWLFLLASFYEKNRPRAIAAPVNFHRETSLFERFQSLDFTGMMGITGAGIAAGWQHMANGANLLFEKKTFDEIGGYAGIDGPASGDDMLFVQKVASRWPGSVAFLKNPAATVLTEAKKDWRGFLSQRLRWGSKTSEYSEKKVQAALALVWLFCANLIVSAAFWPFLGKGWAVFVLGPLFLKMAADWFFLRETASFFGRRDLLRWFVPSFFIHVFYIAVVGAGSLFVKKFEWKGRRVS